MPEHQQSLAGKSRRYWKRPRRCSPDLPLPLDEEKLAVAVRILGEWCDLAIAKQLKFGGKEAMRLAAEAVIRAYVGYDYTRVEATDPSAELKKKNARLRMRLAVAEAECRRAQAQSAVALVTKAKCVQLRKENEQLKGLCPSLRGDGRICSNSYTVPQNPSLVVADRPDDKVTIVGEPSGIRAAVIPGQC